MMKKLISLNMALLLAVLSAYPPWPLRQTETGRRSIPTTLAV